MNASTRFSFASLLVLSALGLAAVTGCSSDPSAPASETPGSQTAKSTATPDPACADKACGVDCTPTGSDEPFSCNAAGACLPTPVELDCKKKCPEFLGDCVQGQSPADADGDGCIDSCK